MVRLLKQLLSNEKGQALPIVLALLAIGGLTIAVNLNYATTSLKGSRIVEEKMAGVYAAGAGVERALWALARPPLVVPAQLSENINGMAVGIQKVNKGTFSLYAGELLERAGPNVDWLSVDGEVVSDGGTSANYTITVTRQDAARGNISLIEVGAALPAGYIYAAGSAASFVGNLSTANPSSNGTTPSGAVWLKWEWQQGKGPEISSANATQYQRFRITGTESLEGDYAWVKAQSQDIGIVSEISGTRYEITATATRPEDGRTTAEIVAAIIMVGQDIQIMSWRITK